MSNGRIVDRRRRCSRACRANIVRKGEGVRRMDLDFAAELVCKFLSGLREREKQFVCVCVDGDNFRDRSFARGKLLNYRISGK